jgi:hypothetical protein
MHRKFGVATFVASTCSPGHVPLGAAPESEFLIKLDELAKLLELYS